MRAKHLVVVAAERVARDERLRRIGEDGCARRAPRRAVVHARGDDAQRAGHELRRARAGRAVPCHIIHRAVPPLREPFEQPLLLAVEIGARDADFLEARALRPSGGCRRRARANRDRFRAEQPRGTPSSVAHYTEPARITGQAPACRARSQRTLMSTATLILPDADRHRSGRCAPCAGASRRHGHRDFRRPRRRQDDARARLPARARLGRRR